MLEVTQQQATQAKSQLQELQQRSNQIQVQACLSPPRLHVVSGQPPVVPGTLDSRCELP